MPEKKKMFQESHERWKELDFPEKQKSVLNIIERGVSGLDSELPIKHLIDELRGDINDSNNWLQMSLELTEAEQYEQALVILDITERLDPEREHLAGFKGYVLTRLGKNEEAKESFKKAIEKTGEVGGYENADGIIKIIETGKVELDTFSHPLQLKEQPAKEDLEKELEALSDELDKILGNSE